MNPSPGLPAAVAVVALAATAAATPPITAANWTESVSFRPEPDAVPADAPRKIKAANLDRFSSLLPDGLALLVRTYGLTMKLAPYQPVHPSRGYIQATNRYRGKPRLIDVGQAVDKRGIRDYVAGLPFPKPQNGLEVAWDFHHAYGGDDAEIVYSVHWVSAHTGVEHAEEWRLSTIRGMGRTDIEPLPHVPALREKGLQGAGLTYARAPYDKKGFGAVYFRSLEPRDSQGHTYIPSMRRVIKNSFGTRGDTWNATDLLYEDVRGYAGYPEWMHWKLIARKTMLLPMHAGVELGKKHAEKTYDFKKAPHWNPRYRWEPRPVYVLEAKPKLPDYPYSKQILVVDAEAFQILYKQAYDRKGALWKIMINSASPHPNEEGDEDILAWSGTVVIDLQSEHATVFHVHRARRNLGLDPNLFTVSQLRKRGT